MIGLGTVINAAGIMTGGAAGLIIGKGLTKRFQDILMTALGLSIIFISIGGALKELLIFSGGQISTQGTLMMIFSLVCGALMGELINIEDHTVRFGEWLKNKTKNTKDRQFVDGFVTSSLTVCIGAMAVVGAITDGISGDYSILLTKAILDTVIILVMTASYGRGCIFSVIPVVIFQGSITLLAKLLLPIMTVQALSNLSLVGSILIFCVGINLTFEKHIKVANLLPSILFAVLWEFLPIPK
jgi:uncharacterized membrane protein YqgA involved in biofilm formation